jgi:hypothetical protein
MVSMSRTTPRTVLLVQLPIPPLGPTPIRGNVPLASAYLKLFAERKGLGPFYTIEVFPARQANTLGDRALVEALAVFCPSRNRNLPSRELAAILRRRNIYDPATPSLYP